MSIISITIFYIILFLVWLSGLSMLLSAGKTLRIGLQSKRWLVTQAQITNNRVSQYTVGAHVDRIYYSYEIVYTYAISGIEYTSRFKRQGFNTKVEAELEVAQLYPVGRVIKVFYNPTKHSESVLSKGFNGERQSEFISQLIFGFVLFNMMTGLLGAAILQSIFKISSTEAGKLTQPFFTLGTATICLTFCCLGLGTIWLAGTNKLRETRERLALFFMGCFMLAIVVPHTIVIGSDILGSLMIGSKPNTPGCYRPDFRQMKWLSTSCPEHVDL